MGRVFLLLLSGGIIGLMFGQSFDSFSAQDFMPPGTQQEPVYRGRPTSFWVAQLQDHDTSFRQQAIQALEQIGPKDESVVPALAGILKDQNTGVRIGAARALCRLG